MDLVIGNPVLVNESDFNSYDNIVEKMNNNVESAVEATNYLSMVDRVDLQNVSENDVMFCSELLATNLANFRTTGGDKLIGVVESETSKAAQITAVSEGFKELIKAGWEWIKKQLKKAVEFISKLYTKVMTSIKGLDSKLEAFSKQNKMGSNLDISEKTVSKIAERFSGILQANKVSSINPNMLDVVYQEQVNYNGKIDDIIKAGTTRLAKMSKLEKTIRLKFNAKADNYSNIKSMISSKDDAIIAGASSRKFENAYIVGIHGKTLHIISEYKIKDGYSYSTTKANVTKTPALKKGTFGTDYRTIASKVQKLSVKNVDKASVKLYKLTTDLDKVLKNANSSELRQLQIQVGELTTVLTSVLGTQMRSMYLFKSDVVWFIELAIKESSGKKSTSKKANESDEIILNLFDDSYEDEFNLFD